MSLKRIVEAFAEKNDIELKSWQKDNLRKIERKASGGDVSEKEVMDILHNEFKKTGFYLKDKSYRDLKSRLF